MKKRQWLIMVLMIALSLPTWATDGYFSLGYNTRHKGIAGAGIGYYYTSIIGGNPAGRVYLGTMYDVNIGLFSPIRQYSVIGAPSMLPNTFGLLPGTIESGTEYFIVPAIGANWAFSEKSALGLSIYGNGGMNTDYSTATFFDESSSSTGVNLSQLFAELSYAYEFAKGQSLGISGVAGYQMFEAKGLNAFGQFGLSSDATKLSNNDMDNAFGLGFKMGYLGKISDQISVGATYQSKIFMSEFKDYAGLFAEEGDFDIPSWWAVGVTYSPIEDLTLIADFKQIMYSGAKSVSNPMNPQNLFPAFLKPGGDPNNPSDYQQNPNFKPLGSENGAGFGWEDMSVVKFGAEYAGVENWIFRGGYSYGKQPIPDSEVLFNILAPGIIEHHIALGFSRNIGQGNTQLHISLNYALNNKVSGVNPLDPVQSIDLEMKQFDVQVGISF
ncbi:MAG: outer membrane protein transport protein [Saprospiraceae bacterium]|nr:outer membrane protein transport protein [Saprospiraceae bacterium]